MVDLTFTPQIEILSAEDAPRRRHWSDADKIRVVEESHRGSRQVTATARRHGIDMSGLRARQVGSNDLDDFDLLLCADDSYAPEPETRSTRAPRSVRPSATCSA